MAPFEALYGRRCRTPTCWNEVGERKPSKVELIDQTIRNNQDNLQETALHRVGKRATRILGEGHWSLKLETMYF